MGIEARWYDEDRRIIATVFQTPWTLTEFYQMVKQTEEMVVGSDAAFYQILDFTASKSLPPNFLTALRSADTKYKTNLGMVLIVGASGFVQAIGVMAQRVGLKSVENVRFVATFDEALRTLEAEIG